MKRLACRIDEHCQLPLSASHILLKPRMGSQKPHCKAPYARHHALAVVPLHQPTICPLRTGTTKAFRGDGCVMQPFGVQKSKNFGPSLTLPRSNWAAPLSSALRTSAIQVEHFPPNYRHQRLAHFRTNYTRNPDCREWAA